MRSIFVAIIRIYQNFISPLFAPTCRFTPSCSSYAIEAIVKYGVIKGLKLAVWRIVRCNPFNEGGKDPVP